MRPRSEAKAEAEAEAFPGKMKRAARFCAHVVHADLYKLHCCAGFRVIRPVIDKSSKNKQKEKIGDKRTKSTYG
jgi:hypothetical protein